MSKRHAPTVTLLAVVLTAGCASETGPTPATSPSGFGAHGTFARYSSGATAITYDPALVPVGGTATVTVSTIGSTTQVKLTVTHLKPRRTYGAHLHVNPCGPTGSAAGPHYQHQPEPAASASRSTMNPQYANPKNEVWLDFTTDTKGDATSAATQPWTIDPHRRPRSLVVHTEATKTMSGHAGDAGARVACVTLPG
jgi:Cu-Zn family superoxide dismutase